VPEPGGSRAGERWKPLSAPAGRIAVRPRGNFEPLQAGELPERRRPPGESLRLRRRKGPVERPRRFHEPRERMPINWHNQGADAGLYSNDDIHAIRILALSPRPIATGAAQRPPLPQPRDGTDADPRRDPGEKIPRDRLGAASRPRRQSRHELSRAPSADTAFTFQTIDAHGMVLNMAQTWHQLRPGEVRTNCGGCHAHSQRRRLSKPPRRRSPTMRSGT
jgi:hypothetical protein